MITVRLSTAMLLIIVKMIESIIQYRKSEKQMLPDHSWMRFIKNLRQISHKIKSEYQLEHYLLSISDKVKKYEANHLFLSQYNSIIEQIHQRLRQREM